MLLCGIFRRLSSADPNSASFLIAYLIHISSQQLINAALIYGLDVISSPRTYASTLTSTYGASVLILAALNAYLLRGGMEKESAFWTTSCGVVIDEYFVINWAMAASRKRTTFPK